MLASRRACIASLSKLRLFDSPQYAQFVAATKDQPGGENFNFLSKIKMESALLIPLFEQKNDVKVLLTVQSNVPESPTKNDTAFPHGPRFSQDTTPLDTALRQASKEIGVSGVEPLCRLVPIPTKAGNLVYPIIGRLPDNWQSQLPPGGVAKVFSLSLQRFLSKRSHRMNRVPGRAEDKENDLFNVENPAPLDFCAEHGFKNHTFLDALGSRTVVQTSGLTAHLCVLAAAMVHGENPPFEWGGMLKDRFPLEMLSEEQEKALQHAMA